MLERLTIPVITQRTRYVVEAVLNRRLAHADTTLRVRDVFHEDALDMVADFYADTGGDLRRVLAATYDATDHASTDRAELVDAPHVRVGVAKWQPPS